MRRLLQLVHDRGLRAPHGARLLGVDLDELAARTRTALRDGPATFADLGARLQQRWPSGRSAAAVRAEGARLLRFREPGAGHAEVHLG